MLLVGYAAIGLTQELHPILDRFSAFEVNETVQIECVISSGSTCNGIDVLRSTDSLTYEIIGNISGVCGSSSDPVTYNFEDPNPVLNAPNYYKLALGGFGFTNVITIIIKDIEEGKLRIAPNPSSAVSQIFFNNPLNQVYRLSIRNLVGESVVRKETREDLFEVNVSNLNAGYYFIHVSSEESNIVVTGVLVVSH